MSLTRPLILAATSTLLSTSLVSQSLVATVETVTDLAATSFEPRPFPNPPFFDDVLVPAGTPILDGFDLVAQALGSSTYASVDVAIEASPHIVTIEEATFAQIPGPPDSQAELDQHTYRVTFTPTRDYSGDLVLRWNGIAQNQGVGSATCFVDVDANGSIDFINGNGAFTVTTFPRSFSTANPLEIDVTLSSSSTGSEFSIHHVILELEFVPDSDTVAPGEFTTSNFGCATSEGLTPLFDEPPPLSGPLVGETFTTRIRNVPAVSPGVFGLLGVPLPPTNLGVIGMDFCFLFVNPVFAFPIVNTGPTLFWDIDIPNQTSLVGAGFRQQVLVFDDPLHNAAGAVMTNSADGIVGGL